MGVQTGNPVAQTAGFLPSSSVTPYTFLVPLAQMMIRTDLPPHGGDDDVRQPSKKIRFAMIDDS